MWRAALAATGGPSLTLFVAAAGVAAATRDEIVWYEVALWAGAIVAGTLFIAVVLASLFFVGRDHLKAIQIKDDWRCTYWTKEQQLKVTVWFEDRLDSTRYDADCTAEVGGYMVQVDEDVRLGGVYLGKQGLQSGNSGPTMAEFLKKNVSLHPPPSATIRVRIQPRDPWGAANEESKTVPIQVVDHGTGKSGHDTSAGNSEGD